MQQKSTSHLDLLLERQQAKAQSRLLAIYIAFNAYQIALYTNPFGEYILVQIYENNVVKATQMSIANTLVMTLTRAFIGGPSMGAMSDIYGRRFALVVSTAVQMVTMVVFLYFPSSLTMFAGTFVSAIFTQEPIQQAYLADLTRIYVRTDSVVGANKVNPEEAATTIAKEKEVTQNEFAKKSSRMIGMFLAAYTFNFAVGSILASILTYKEDEEDDTVAISSFNVTNSTTVDACEVDEGSKNADSDHLWPSFYGAIFSLAICQLLSFKIGTIVSQQELSSESESQVSVAPKKFSKEAFTFVVTDMLSKPFVRILVTILFCMKTIEAGALAIFYFYMKFQFDVTTSVFALFMMVLIFCNAFANTIMVTLFGKCMKSLWNAAVFAGLMMSLMMVGYVFADNSTTFIALATLNVFNFVFALMRGKVFSNFQPSEYGRVAGGMDIVQQLGGFFGPLILAAAFTFGVDQTGLPECAIGDDKHYFEPTIPWMICGFMIFGVVGLVPLGKRLDPSEKNEG